MFQATLHKHIFCRVKVDRIGVMDEGREKIDGEWGMSSGENKMML